MRRSETLLSRTDEAVAVTGVPISVIGGRVFTVAIHTSNLTGIVTIEATVADDPDEIDWFPVLPPVSYPSAGQTATCRALGFSFTGRFSAIRARLSRPGVALDADIGGQLGYVDRVLLGRVS